MATPQKDIILLLEKKPIVYLAKLQTFSCASAKAERDLSNLHGVFSYVELGDPPLEMAYPLGIP